jgi:DNA invertase Pin-like site-specific DNA recombinase
LREAVTVETDRRTRAAPRNEPAPVNKESSRGRPAGPGQDKVKAANDIPAGKANLIQASFKAGLKPATIARNLRISESLVRRVLSEKAKN